MSSTISTKGDRAYELFKEGYNCSQSVFGAFSEELGVDFDTAVKLASGFGGGIGRMREVCGAFSGLVMAASLIYGYDDPKATTEKTALYEKIRALADKFCEDNGSIICKELLGLQAAEKSAVPEARTSEYYKKRPCAELCRYAADLLEEFIRNNPV